MAERTLDYKGEATMNEGTTYVVQDDLNIELSSTSGWIKILDDPWLEGGGSSYGILNPNFYQIDFLKNFWLSKSDLPNGNILTSWPKITMRGILKGLTNIRGTSGPPPYLKCSLEIQQFLLPPGGSLSSLIGFDVYSAKHMVFELPKDGRNHKYKYLTLPWRNGYPTRSFDCSQYLNYGQAGINIDRSSDLHIVVQARFKVELLGFAKVQLSGYKYRDYGIVSDHIPFGFRIPTWEVIGWA